MRAFNPTVLSDVPLAVTNSPAPPVTLWFRPPKAARSKAARWSRVGTFVSTRAALRAVTGRGDWWFETRGRTPPLPTRMS